LLKIENDESVKKFTVLTLIIYNDNMLTNVTKLTNMIKLNCLEYSCF
jgi:hypothetical protein